MGVLIWIGAAVSLAGLAGIVWCIVAVARAKRSGLDDADMRVRLQRVVIWNVAALGVSGLGLAMVIVGILLS